MLSVSNMTLILDKFFFPRWLQTLAMWLNHNPNYTQVTEWYSGWKRMVSDDLLAQPTIKGKGLEGSKPFMLYIFDYILRQLFIY